MKVLLYKTLYVTDFVLNENNDLIGPNGNKALDVEMPPQEELDRLFDYANAYKYDQKTNSIIFDVNKYNIMELEAKKNELRKRREIECFSIINRGELWYETLTQNQKEELSIWYNDWLNVTDTMTVPEPILWV